MKLANRILTALSAGVLGVALSAPPAADCEYRPFASSMAGINSVYTAWWEPYPDGYPFKGPGGVAYRVSGKWAAENGNSAGLDPACNPWYSACPARQWGDVRTDSIFLTTRALVWYDVRTAEWERFRK